MFSLCSLSEWRSRSILSRPLLPEGGKCLCSHPLVKHTLQVLERHLTLLRSVQPIEQRARCKLGSLPIISA
jgi:hypothetical protein